MRQATVTARGALVRLARDPRRADHPIDRLRGPASPTEPSGPARGHVAVPGDAGRADPCRCGPSTACFEGRLRRPHLSDLAADRRGAPVLVLVLVLIASLWPPCRTSRASPSAALNGSGAPVNPRIAALTGGVAIADGPISAARLGSSDDGRSLVPDLRHRACGREAVAGDEPTSSASAGSPPEASGRRGRGRRSRRQPPGRRSRPRGGVRRGRGVGRRARRSATRWTAASYTSDGTLLKPVVVDDDAERHRGPGQGLQGQGRRHAGRHRGQVRPRHVHALVGQPAEGQGRAPHRPEAVHPAHRRRPLHGPGRRHGRDHRRQVPRRRRRGHRLQRPRRRHRRHRPAADGPGWPRGGHPDAEADPQAKAPRLLQPQRWRRWWWWRRGGGGGSCGSCHFGGSMRWPVAGGHINQYYHYGHYGLDIGPTTARPSSPAAAGRGDVRRLAQQRRRLPGLDQPRQRHLHDLQPHVVGRRSAAASRSVAGSAWDASARAAGRPARTSTSRSGSGPSGMAATASTR